MKEAIETYSYPSFKEADLDTATGVPVKLAIPLATEKQPVPESNLPYRISGGFRHRIQQVLPHYVYSGTDLGTRPAYVAGQLEYINEKGELVEAYAQGGLEVFDGRFCMEATKRDVIDYLRRLLKGYTEDLIPVNRFWLDQRIEFSEKDGCKFKVFRVSKPTKTNKCYIHFRRWSTESSITGFLQSLRLQSAVPHRICKDLSVTRETFFKVIYKKLGITPDMIENMESRP